MIPGFSGDSGILESPESAESLGFPRFPRLPGSRAWKAKSLELWAFLESQEIRGFSL